MSIKQSNKSAVFFGDFMDIDIKMNDAYIPYLNKKQKTQIFFGGSFGGKSLFICQKIVLDCLDGANWLVCHNVARTIQKLDRDGNIIELAKEIPADTTAQIFWLKNRRPNKWRDRVENVNTEADSELNINIIGIKKGCKNI